MENKNEMTIEEAFSRLDAILEKLDKGETTLEETFTEYQNGLELIRICNERIDGIEKKIQVLEAGER